jgi:hypothetical protein
MMVQIRKIDWLAEVIDPSNGYTRNYGVVTRRYDLRWLVVYGVPWWRTDECEVVATVDSRDAAVGFIKLLKEN